MNNLIPLPYRILAVVLLWLGSLAAVGIWQHHAGAMGERVTWQAKEVTEQATAAAQFKALYDAARKAEQDNAAKMAALAAAYERKLTDANKQRAADIAAVRAGIIRLRDPGAAVPTCPSATAQAGSAAGGSDGVQGGGLSAAPAGLLSGQTSEWLIDFAADADEITRQLAACQQVIVRDREGEEPP